MRLEGGRGTGVATGGRRTANAQLKTAGRGVHPGASKDNPGTGANEI